MAERSSPTVSRAPTGSRRLASGTEGPSAAVQGIPVVAFLRDSSLVRWISREFHPLDTSLTLTDSHLDMTARLFTEPTPRLLLVSIDELSMDELIALKGLRPSGWRGLTIALSHTRMLPALRLALGIDRLLTPPFVQDLFSDILRELVSCEAVPEDQDAWVATNRITTGSSSRYTATPEDSMAESMENPRVVSSEVSSSMRTNRR